MMTTQTLETIGTKYGTDKSSLGHNYLGHYELFLQHLKDESFNFIEIGGLDGASLRMWEEFFPRARIICIDVNPGVQQHCSDRISVEVGDSGSPSFLLKTADKIGNARVILDDGSHRWDHQRIAFKTLFDFVEPGGFYIIEDVHSSYEKGFAGSDDTPFIEILYKLVDFLNTRGDKRVEMESFYNKDLVTIAKSIDLMIFVPRACLIKKKRLQLRDG